MKKAIRFTSVTKIDANKIDPLFAGNLKVIQEKEARPLEGAELTLLQELRSVGVSISSVWDLVNTNEKYAEAIPVLLRHVQLSHSERTLEAIGRSLIVNEARGHASILMRKFISLPFDATPLNEYTSGAKWAIGAAVGHIAIKADIPGIRDILKEERHGCDRIGLLNAIKRNAKEIDDIEDFLKELGQDQYIGSYADALLRSVAKKRKIKNKDK